MFSDFVIEHVHLEEARGVGSSSSSTSVPPSLPEPSPATSPMTPTTLSSTLVAAPASIVMPPVTTTPPPATTPPLPTPTTMSSTQAHLSPTLMEFVTPLPDDVDRLDVNYHNEPLRYCTMESILGEEPELHQVHEDGEPRSFAEADEQAAW